jgi:hypothetical protein
MADKIFQPQQKQEPSPLKPTNITAGFDKPGKQTSVKSLNMTGRGGGSPPDIPLTPQNILFLQRTIGNRAVVRLAQRKAKISQPGDEYEREADRVAEQVEQMHAPPISRKAATSSCGANCACEDCSKRAEEGVVQTKEDAGETPVQGPGVESRISSLGSGGEPLAETVRAFYEPRFGRDFGGVRVHRGPQAAEAARAVNARAYTAGSDIVFGANEYAPETSRGKRLLAHELTHVAQQEAAGNTAVQRQPDTESVGLPPEHPDNIAAIEEVEESLKPPREERADKQQELTETQRSSPDPEEEEALRAREKEIRERLSQVEKDLADGLQKKIGLIDTAISYIERVLPSQTGGGAPEVEQEVWNELDRLRAMRKAAEKELLLVQRAQKRELIRGLNEAIKALPEGSPERVAMEKALNEAAEFLSKTAVNRAAPGTVGPRAGESGRSYVVYSGYVKVGGSLPWINNNPGNVQRSPNGVDPPGVLGLDKSGADHYIFESMEVGEKGMYFDVLVRRGGNGKSLLRTVLRSYIAGGKTDEELPEECPPGANLSTCVTRGSAQSYPGKVSGTAGLTDKLGTPIGSLDASELARLIEAIKIWEGAKVKPGDTYTCANENEPLYRNLLGCDE